MQRNKLFCSVEKDFPYIERGKSLKVWYVHFYLTDKIPKDMPFPSDNNASMRIP
jgi:hypothetical protein